MMPLKCQHCDAELTLPIVCAGCHALYPPANTSDYFELFGLKPVYPIDQDHLRTLYLSLARHVHPDRYVGQTDGMHTRAIELSAMINRAYDVLKDPILRASYLLEQAGGPSAAEVRDVPGDLLAEVMMLREEIDDAKASEDGGALDRLRSLVQTKRDEQRQTIAERATRIPGADDASKQELRKLINSMKYYDNLLKEIGADPFRSASKEKQDG